MHDAAHRARLVRCIPLLASLSRELIHRPPPVESQTVELILFSTRLDANCFQGRIDGAKAYGRVHHDGAVGSSSPGLFTEPTAILSHKHRDRNVRAQPRNSPEQRIEVRTQALPLDLLLKI